MKYDEYLELSKGLSNPDTMADVLVTFLDNLKGDLTVKESLEATNAQLTEQNNMLRDTNTKLALRVTGVPETPPEPEKELEGQEALDDLVNRIREDK